MLYFVKESNIKSDMKNIKVLVYIRIAFVFSAEIISFSEKRGVVIVPVADMVSTPLLYNDLPYACIENDKQISCSRVHQLLFNDRVTILKEESSGFLILTKHVFSFNGNKRIAQTCWIDKKNIALFEDLTTKKLHQSHFPPERIDKIIRNRTVLTLKKPFFEQKTGLTFSVGTQFIILKKQKEQCLVTIFDPKKYTFISQFIPKKYYWESVHGNQEKQNQYVDLIREWISSSDGYIPYVWGGTSFTSLVSENSLRLENFCYTRSALAGTIKTGFDCSSLILRAAQICSIPYFFKNTTTLAYYLRPLALGEKAQKGDLIFFPGHVQIISDIEKNLIIEAAGYKSGYGRVHEKKIREIFQDKTTIDSLVAAYHAKEKLSRLNRDGTVEMVPYCKILSFSSVWTA